jgi:hypothetical protein
MTYHWKQLLIVCGSFVCGGTLLLTAFANVGTTAAYGQEGPLAAGSWGGQHISLEVTAEGAIAEYDCAHGTISQGITLDQRGRFSVQGFHVSEHGGPVREGQQADRIPVQFTGRVSDKRMYLTVRRRSSGKLIGSFALIFGQEASLVKCR